MTDCTEDLRHYAASLANVDQGTSCTQTAFKSNGKAFLYVGEQGGRFKAMVKLDASLDEAKNQARKHPDDFQIAKKGGWVTARFSADAPLPKRLWKKWIDESYHQCQPKPR